MRIKSLIKFVAIPFGIALLFAGLFFDGGQASSNAMATPTPDRLAKPTMPPSPSQADHGAQAYWLNCSPCHGDQGQGLTDEFRRQYPLEDQNCWKSHCHGNVTYENGFTIPKVIPRLVGPGALVKFQTAANLYGFIHAAMPFQKPNSLSDEEYYQITAFLLRQNGLIADNVNVDASNADSIAVSRGTAVVTPQQAEVQKGSGALPWLGILLILSVLFFILKKIQNKATI